MFKKVAFLIVLASMVLTACQPAAAPTAAPVERAAPAATEAPAAAPTEAPAKVWTYADMTVGFLQTGSEGGWRR